MRRRATSQARQPREASPAETGLRVQAPTERLSMLLREHDRLVREAAARKKQLQKLAAELRAVSARMSGRLAPLVEQFEQLDGEVHGIFRTLLDNPRIAKQKRGRIRKLYEALQRQGILSRRHPSEPEGFSAAVPPVPPAHAGGFSARRPGAEGTLDSIRQLFRRLAGALHPDKVQDEEEKALRTEAMKEITRAYESGDLARLLQLEKSWMGRREVVASADEDAQRVSALERTIRDLRAQIVMLMGELRELRQSPPAQLARDMKRRQRSTGTDPLDDLVSDAEADVQRTRATKDWVLAYQDGKISLDDLLAGPPQPGPEDLFVELEGFIVAEIFDEPPTRTGKKSRSRRSR